MNYYESKFACDKVEKEQSTLLSYAKIKRYLNKIYYFNIKLNRNITYYKFPIHIRY